MDKRIVVPGGMIEAVKRSARYIDTSNECLTLHQSTQVAMAIAEWLSENPIVPTGAQIVDMQKTVPHGQAWTGHGAVEWQRRMFLAPEPVVPEEVKDLLWDGQTGEDEEHNRKVIEAFNRGRRSKA